MIKIFAIDIKCGKVVKAYAGARFNYKPLKLKKKDFSDADFVIKNVIKKFGITEIYIADLDSIENKNNNWEMIEKLVKKNQKVNFLIDSGFNRISKLRNFKMFFKGKNFKNLTTVIGSESISNLRLINQISMQSDSVISLDFFNKKKHYFFSKKLVADKFILMSLKQVGGRGVNWNFLKLISKFISPKKCIVAGGVKYEGEIKKLKMKGYCGIIISTLIHRRLI